MNTIKEFIEETVQSNTKKMMAGDDSISTKVAINIAMEAANMGASAAAKQVMGQKRFELACQVAGRCIANSLRWDKQDVDESIGPACKIGLSIVDTMLQTIAAEKAVPGDETTEG